MHLCSQALLFLVVARLLVPASSVPLFDIDLDGPPENRWDKVATHYRTHLIGMAKALKPSVVSHAPWAWVKTVKFNPQHEAEMKGIVDTINDPEVTLDVIKEMNMMYEMASRTSCSGVLWALPNGTVMQGRNMDTGIDFTMPDGRHMNWPDVTFHAIFRKHGKRLFQSTHWPGQIGVHTGMRFDGWSFQQNTRRGGGNWHKNFQAAQKGGKPFMVFAREVMETIPLFKDAVDKISTASYSAPQYFIMSGMGPFEGVVITVDRLGEHSVSTPPIQRVSNEDPAWHLVQTNDDSTSEPVDVRRPLADFMLSKATQDIISVQHLMEFLHTSPLKWEGPDGTVFSTVMVPFFGYYSTTLPSEAPGPIEQKLFSKVSANGPVEMPPALEAMIKQSHVQKGSFLERRRSLFPHP